MTVGREPCVVAIGIRVSGAPGRREEWRARVFVLYGLLGDASPPFSHEILSRELSRFFSGDERLSVSSRALPFGGRRVVALSWPSWEIRVAYEEGDSVAEDSAEIHRRLGAAAADGLPGIRRRIRAVFGDDDGREYTNETIEMMEFLTAIPGVVVFDPQQNNILGAC
jgi:hypothetical protein